MKRIFLLTAICFTVVFLVDCKKDAKDIPIGTIKTKIGSTESTFSINAKAKRLNVTNGYGIQVEGYYRTGSTTSLAFTIVSPNQISTTTYTENPGSNPLVTMTHCVEVIFPCVLQTSAFGSVTNPLSVTITEITGTYVRGTFKGELKSTSSSNTSTEVYSDGIFYVSF